MTLRELRYLVALADLGHFGRAAEACHVSQPTLSTQVRKLEDLLGVSLFERTNKTLSITPIGERIVARARRVLAEADSIVELARQGAAPLSGPLNLGVIPTLGPYVLPWLVPALREAYPALRLIVHEGLTDHLLERLASYRLDAALLALPVEGGGLRSVALLDEPFLLAYPPGHRLAGAGPVSQTELGGEPLLLLTDGHCLREQALAVCARAGTPAHDEAGDFRATSLETIRQMVAAGMGCTLLPAMAVGTPDNLSIGIRPLGFEASRRIGLVSRASYPKGDELELLAQTIRAHAPGTVRAA